MTSSRREFIKKTAAVSAGFTILPSGIYGQGISPSDKLNLAAVGVGGRGESLLSSIMDTKRVNAIALCDVDQLRAAKSFKRNKRAKTYTDFRRMFDKHHKKIDAVVVATPDHNHATIALPALELGKHVYCEKPLAHNIREARLMTQAAAKAGVVTQMGNQGSSGEGVRLTREWIDAGLIGEVTRVHAWTNRPIWPQGVSTPKATVEIPKTLDWDQWLGPAQYREFNPAYMPFKWRGWWDYGTGALGDMACHIIDGAFTALELGYPISAEASVGQVYVGDFVEADYGSSCPPNSVVNIQFPERGDRPPVELIWYDGGMKPPRPEELGPDEPFGTWDGGVLFEGSEGKILTGVYNSDPVLLPRSRMKDFAGIEPTLRRVDEGHYANWVNACIDGGETSSPFSLAGPLTETVLMGNLAIRSHEMKVLKDGRKVGDWAPYNYPGRVKLLWDGAAMEVTNFKAANQYVTREYRKGWEI